MCINTAIDSINHRRYRGQNCVGILVAPGNFSISPPPHPTSLLYMHCTVYPLMHRVCVCITMELWLTAALKVCVCVDNCVSVLRERKEAMSHSTNTTRTQQLPLLLGQGNPQRCGCIVWKNRADRDIIGRLSPTAASRRGRGGGERRGKEGG